MRHWIADVGVLERVSGTLGRRTYGPTAVVVVACRDHAAWPITAADVAQDIRPCFSKNWPLGQGLQQKLTVAAIQSSVEQWELQSAVHKQCVVSSVSWNEEWHW